MTANLQDEPLAERNVDFAIVVDFDDEEAFSRNLAHPAHGRLVGEFLKPILESRHAIQFKRFRAAFPDVRLAVEALVAEGDLVAARWTMLGTHTGPWGDVAPTGQKVHFTGVNFFRIADGKIVEIWNVRDDLGLREQLGVAVYAGYPEQADG